MKLVRRILLLAAFLALGNSFAATVIVDPIKTGYSSALVNLGSMTYATLTAKAPCTSARDGYRAFASDWGAYGTDTRCIGSLTRWVPVGGRVLLKHIGAGTSGINGTNTIVLQVQMPVGTVQAGDQILFDVPGLTKSGTTDNLQASVYAGTAGTTSDTALASVVNIIAGTSVTGSLQWPWKVANNTTAQRVGPPNSSGLYSGSSTTAAPAATPITDLSANALYFSFAIKSSSTTDTVGIQDGAIWQIVN